MRYRNRCVQPIGALLLVKHKTDVVYAARRANRLDRCRRVGERPSVGFDMSESFDAIVVGAGTAGAAAALNLAREAHTDIPFFFGGDGATLLVPDFLLDLTMQALAEHRENAADNFNMDLRVGQVPVADLYRKGQKLLIAKARPSETPAWQLRK